MTVRAARVGSGLAMTTIERGARPITLIDGKRLAELSIENEIAGRRRNRRTIMSRPTYLQQLGWRSLEKHQAAFDSMWADLCQKWPTDDLVFERADYSEKLGLGHALRFAVGERDDNDQGFVVAHVPGNYSALKRLKNQDFTGLLYTIYTYWLKRREHSGTPLYICADHFTDRAAQRFDYLSPLVPRLTLLQVRNHTHRVTLGAQVPGDPSKAGVEAAFGRQLVHAIRQGIPFGDLRLTVLGVEVPAGWAVRGSEMIDILAVDQSGRLVVVELKAISDSHQSSLRHAVFQSLRYWNWARDNRRALQIIYGRDAVRDLQAEPVLLIVNQGCDFPADMLDVQRAAPTEGAEPLLRMFRCADGGVEPMEVTVV